MTALLWVRVVNGVEGVGVEAGRPLKKWQQWPRWKTQVTWSYALAMKSEGQLLDSKYILKGEWTGWWVEYETWRGGGKEDPQRFWGKRLQGLRERMEYIYTSAPGFFAQSSWNPHNFLSDKSTRNVFCSNIWLLTLFPDTRLLKPL